MALQSVNPATGETVRTFDVWDDARIEQALATSAAAAARWRDTAWSERALLLRRTAELLRQEQEAYARLMAVEMGKLLGEARAEIEKCALTCEYFADVGEALLASVPVVTDAAKSYVRYEPLGTVFAIMPWNFPFWQVLRCAIPTLAAGNTLVLKHASNVPQCALALQDLLHAAGFPVGVLTTLMIDAHKVAAIIADKRVHAVTLTGSTQAGRVVASLAGQHLKKTVLELGGADAFIVLADANLDLAVPVALASRYMNAGQSCIAAKRFIVVEDIATEFSQRLQAGVAAFVPGDPCAAGSTLAPLARQDLRAALHNVVEEALSLGAHALAGCTLPPGKGAYYPASILTGVTPAMRAYNEELFGPVAVVHVVTDAEQALRCANASAYGLGGSVWTGDSTAGEHMAQRLHCGNAFVNAIVKSDPRLPFGGIKDSGYGRELAHYGLHEFTNVKTLWCA